MASDNVFGSGDLTPELLRGARFAEHDGRYDATEVREFLDRVASALEVYLATDAASALRAEFRRNAEIAQQVLDAGQNAAQHVKQQAAEEARELLEQTQQAHARAREELDAELAQSREQVGSMRTALIQDLRDLYDRIGASLYRFERAVDEQQAAPISEPSIATLGAEQPAVTDVDDIGQILPTGPQVAENLRREEAQAAADNEAAATPEPAPDPDPEPEPAVEPQATPDVELPEGAKPPAWTQIPAQAYTGEQPGVEHASEAAAVPPADDPFAVVEDEPLAPGEPLVDLRDLSSAADAAEPAPEVAPDATALMPESEDVLADLGGSWLSEPAVEHTPDAERDDALAELLIAAEPVQPAPAAEPSPDAQTPPATDMAQEPGSDDGLGGSWLSEPSVSAHGEQPAPGQPAQPAAPVDPFAPVPQAAPAPAPAASPDALETYQLIRDSIASGQSRETVESYLRDQLGIVEPAALINAALGMGPPG